MVPTFVHNGGCAPLPRLSAYVGIDPVTPSPGTYAGWLPRKCGNVLFSAIRAGHSVRFFDADDFFRAITHARVDNSMDRIFHSFRSPDLLILHELDLDRVTAQQSADLSRLDIARQMSSS